VADLRSGAMGCDTYDCPPRHITDEMKGILFDEEFVGWFKEVVFAIYPAGQTWKTSYDVFKDVFKASVLNRVGGHPQAFSKARPERLLHAILHAAFQEGLHPRLQ